MAAQSWNCCGGGASQPRPAEGEDVQGAGETDRRAYSFGCWDWCSGARVDKRRGGIRFGYLLIVLGLLWLGGALGWIRAEIVWPAIVIAFGIWLAVLSRIRWRRKT